MKDKEGWTNQKEHRISWLMCISCRSVRGGTKELSGTRFIIITMPCVGAEAERGLMGLERKKKEKAEGKGRREEGKREGKRGAGEGKSKR